MNLNNFISKSKKYIEIKIFQKYIDNKYWKLMDESSNQVTRILKDEAKDDLKLFYPELNLEKLKSVAPKDYTFVCHILSRYLYKVSNCVIDPKYNWVILDRKHIFLYSFPLVEDPWDGYKSRPSLLGYTFKPKVVKLVSAILVKYIWTNYYHFLVDTLSQINLIDESNIPLDIPIIVPYYYANKNFVKDYISNFPLNRKIIVQQPDTYYSVKELYVAKDVTCSNWVNILRNKVFSIIDKIAAQKVQSPELLFVTRKKIYKRTANCIDEMEKLVATKGFTIIEPGDYSFLEQIKLFSNARMVIGIHGAALTNVIFTRHNDLKLLEIYPGGGLNPEHYKNICLRLGFRHDSISGDGLNAERVFNLDIELFKSALNRFLEPGK